MRSAKTQPFVQKSHLMKTEMLRFQASILPTSEHVHCAGGVSEGALRSLRAMVVIIENPPTNPTRCHQILTGGHSVELIIANDNHLHISPLMHSTETCCTGAPQYRDREYWSHSTKNCCTGTSRTEHRPRVTSGSRTTAEAR